MKTFLKLSLFFILLAPKLFFAQHEAEEKLRECKNLTILILKGETTFNGVNLQEKLTNSLVNLASYGSDYTDAYTAWSSTIVEQRKESMNSQLSEIEGQRQNSEQLKKQSLTNMVNDVTNNLQTQYQESRKTAR